MPLTDTQCRAANVSGKREKRSDGGGLRLVVTPKGGKNWELAYRFAGKPKTWALGPYPTVSLAAARLKREQAKLEIQAGRDPAAPPEEIDEGPTFGEVAERWRAAQAGRWNETRRPMIERRFARDVLPTLGDRRIRTIRPADVLEVVRAAEARGALEVSRRIAQQIAAVFAMAKVEGLRDDNPATDLQSAMVARKRVEHHAKVKDLVDFMRRLQAYDGEETTRLALQMILRTAVRTAELRFATWDEIEGDLWRIPGGRMKVGLEHLIPLAPGALRILARMKEIAGGSGLIFPGERGKPLSSNTLLYAIYRMGLHSRATVHGLRGTFSTAANESGLFMGDWIEMQLAHGPEDPVRGAYNSALYLPQRREIMAWWDAQVDQADVAALLL